MIYRLINVKYNKNISWILTWTPRYLRILFRLIRHIVLNGAIPITPIDQEQSIIININKKKLQLKPKAQSINKVHMEVQIRYQPKNNCLEIGKIGKKQKPVALLIVNKKILWRTQLTFLVSHQPIIQSLLRTKANSLLQI